MSLQDPVLIFIPVTPISEFCVASVMLLLQEKQKYTLFVYCSGKVNKQLQPTGDPHNLLRTHLRAAHLYTYI
jgi:hypothetical protein